jgi:hypothetical protein
VKKHNLPPLNILAISALGGIVIGAHGAIAQTPVPITSTPSQTVTQQRQYQTQGVIFEAPPGFSDVQPLGNQTVGIVFPATALQTRRLTVRLAEFNPAAIGMALLEPRELSEYARYSFFGITTTPTTHKTRRFLGQDVTGDILMQSQNGATTYLEFYVVPLSLQRRLCIAFEADTELPVSLLEQTIQTVANSMREVPPSKKRKKR